MDQKVHNVQLKYKPFTSITQMHRDSKPLHIIQLYILLLIHLVELFAISPQYKIGNIANFVLAMVLKIITINKVSNLER